MSIACPLTRLSISHANHVATGKSTRPRGARLRRTICDFWSRNFNPRARMGRDKRSTTSSSSGASFNSRARLGRDLHRVDGEHDVVVSIHAPAWGATVSKLDKYQLFDKAILHQSRNKANEDYATCGSSILLSRNAREHRNKSTSLTIRAASS